MSLELLISQKLLMYKDPIKAIIDIPNKTCVNETEIFENKSEIGCNGNDPGQDDAFTYEWDFGNCVTITDIALGNSIDPYPNTTYSYPEAGIYTVTMTATSLCGSSEDTTTIKVYPNPIVNCSGTDECLNDITQFNANASKRITNYKKL